MELNAPTIDTALKSFLKEMDELQEQYRDILAEAKQSEATKRNV